MPTSAACLLSPPSDACVSTCADECDAGGAGSTSRALDLARPRAGGKGTSIMLSSILLPRRLSPYGVTDRRVPRDGKGPLDRAISLPGGQRSAASGLSNTAAGLYTGGSAVFCKGSKGHEGAGAELDADAVLSHTSAMLNVPRDDASRKRAVDNFRDEGRGSGKS